MLKSTIISSILIVFIAFVFLFVTVPPAFSQTTPLKATIIATSGEVLVLKKDTTIWESAQPGDILSGGDTIKTLEGARAELQFPSGSSIVLNEDTSLVIESLAFNQSAPKEERTEVFLIDGKIKAIIEKLDKGERFEIKTPTAIAGVRGTVFYLNVTRESERIMTGLHQDTDEKVLFFSLMDRLLGVKNCYAAFDGIITEIFVEEGVVDFTNLISQIAYMVGENQGSFADEEGKMPEPKDVPPDEQNEWKTGFAPPPPKDEGKKDDGADKKKDPPTKKAETSTTEGPVPPPPPGGPLDLTTPDQGPTDPTEGPGPEGDLQGTGTTTPTNTSVNIGVNTYEQRVREELVALHNDVANIGDSILLAQLDDRLTQIQDAQEGKVMYDREGYRVQSESRVWSPTNNKVAFIHLTERSGGSHAGISSSTFEVTFNKSLEGANLRALPWAEIMGSTANEPITYSSSQTPEYHVKVNNSEFNPTTEQAGMVLTLKNPQGDYNKIYEGFGSLNPAAGGGWEQAPVTPTPFNMLVNDIPKNIDYRTGTWTTSSDLGGIGTFGDASYSMTAYVIGDDGKERAGDAEITSIRDILAPTREYNLELSIGATDEFGGNTIDTIVTPEIMRPYHSEE